MRSVRQKAAGCGRKLRRWGLEPSNEQLVTVGYALALFRRGNRLSFCARLGSGWGKGHAAAPLNHPTAFNGLSQDAHSPWMFLESFLESHPTHGHELTNLATTTLLATLAKASDFPRELQVNKRIRGLVFFIHLFSFLLLYRFFSMNFSQVVLVRKEGLFCSTN